MNTCGEQVCKEILDIMRVYHEQEKTGNVGTPGGLEHMGDVWSLLSKWERMLLDNPAAAWPPERRIQVARRIADALRQESRRRIIGAMRVFDLSDRLLILLSISDVDLELNKDNFAEFL